MNRPVDLDAALVRSIAAGVSVVAQGPQEGTHRILRRARDGTLRDPGAGIPARAVPAVAALLGAGYLSTAGDGTLAPTASFLAAMGEHDESKPPLYYDLSPVRRPGFRDHARIASAAVVRCIATGRDLAGAGGPGYALSPDIVHALDMHRSGAGPKVILDAADFDRMERALAMARDALCGHGANEEALLAVKGALAAVAPGQA